MELRRKWWTSFLRENWARRGEGVMIQVRKENRREEDDDGWSRRRREREELSLGYTKLTWNREKLRNGKQLLRPSEEEDSLCNQQLMFPMLLKEERSSFHGNNDSHSINSNGYSTDAASRRTSVLMVKTGRKNENGEGDQWWWRCWLREQGETATREIAGTELLWWWSASTTATTGMTQQQ